MILRIFIAITALNILHASHKLALHPENNLLLARKASTETEHTTSTSWSLCSSVSLAYNRITHLMSTPEEILCEKLKNIVFPDGRNAAGEIVADYKLPPLTEIVNQDNDVRVLCTDLEGKIAFTDNIDTYYLAIITLDGFAAMGCKDAISLLAWLFESNHSSHKIKWQYPDRERAAWFREVANELLTGCQTQEEIYKVLQELLKTGRESLHIQPEDKKGR